MKAYTDYPFSELADERNAASDAYFEARPQIDCNDRRKVFDAGYNAASESLHRQLAESQAREAKILGYFRKAISTCFDKQAYERTLSDPSFFVNQAIALPNDDTALNELIAERTKELTAQLEAFKNGGE